MPEIGDELLVHYVESIHDGLELRNTYRTGDPIKTRIGSHELLPLVERALCDMQPGEKRTVSLEPDEAYGSYDEALVQHVPASLMPNAENLPVGNRVQLKTRIGSIDARVISVSFDEVVLDCNHELAGQAIDFDIELVAEVHESAIDRELHPVGCACGCHRLKEQLT